MKHDTFCLTEFSTSQFRLQFDNGMSSVTDSSILFIFHIRFSPLFKRLHSSYKAPYAFVVSLLTKLRALHTHRTNARTCAHYIIPLCSPAEIYHFGVLLRNFKKQIQQWLSSFVIAHQWAIRSRSVTTLLRRNCSYNIHILYDCAKKHLIVK